MKLVIVGKEAGFLKRFQRELQKLSQEVYTEKQAQKVNLINYDSLLINSEEKDENAMDLISNAVELSVPTFILCPKSAGEQVFPIVLGDKKDLLKVKYYDEKNIPEISKEVCNELAEGISSKFTFNLSVKLKDYLDWIVQTRNISRSTYLRSILEEKMKKDGKYKKSI